MCRRNRRPDPRGGALIAFSCLLFACSHAGAHAGPDRFLFWAFVVLGLANVVAAFVQWNRQHPHAQ